MIMIRKLTQYVYSNQVKFFIANCKQRDNVLSEIYLEKISKQKYNFGIILNDSNYNTIYKSSYTKLYSPIEIVDYYCLDVIMTPASCLIPTIYKFIFLDIKKLYNNDINFNNFEFWLRDIINDTAYLSKIFFVMDINPYFYRKVDSHNNNIKMFINLLHELAFKNCHVITTDNDIFANISIYKNTASYKNIKFLLAGKISENKIKPYIFYNEKDYNFFNGYYVIDNSLNISGYVEIILSGSHSLLEYIHMDHKEIAREIIHSIIKLIETSENNEEKRNKLIKYRKYIYENNIIDVYKYNFYDKTLYKNHLRFNFLDKILYEVDNIIFEGFS
ncbi:hypothetical protein QJ854_gp639 [Moumouvirus goulette]|uniref:Uncharacterized protein n=1 Tax=Moumouvirus goulette TaxID=1247379 RepID=M1PGL1_9VIRU|nr:hypothetical protein QJ854_gp639 [Moumouvirus goulette]AGF85143.1 hypothetical protein glt_00334 [Moumouvirus goulette]